MSSTPAASAASNHRTVLRDALAEVHSRYQQEAFDAGERWAKRAERGIVAAPDLDAARLELRKLFRAAGDRDDLARGNHLQKALKHEVAQPSRRCRDCDHVSSLLNLAPRLRRMGADPAAHREPSFRRRPARARPTATRPFCAPQAFCRDRQKPSLEARS